jgi:DNA-binding NtrC family response regulator
MTTPVRVLLVDDERTYIDALAKVLGRRGMTVRTACDGHAAVEAAHAEPFDVIVLDLKMPRMDGVATLEAIRSRDARTPVLLLSAHADLDSAREAMSRGATDYLLKPCPVDDLVTAIEDAHERAGYANDLARRTRVE